MKKRTFLKTYLFIMLILFPVVLFFDITTDEPSDWLDGLDYVFWVVALLGVWCFCYKKTILSETFWKAFLPFIIIWDLFIIYIEFKGEPILSDPVFLGFMVIIYLIIILPQYLGLYWYAYKNDN